MATKNIVPNSDGEGKLGTSSKSWAEGHIDSITGTIATAAQTNITSVGALNGGTITSGFGAINNGASAITTTGLISGGSLDIDNVLINGTTIGHTDDTDLMTLADGVLTIAGELDAVSLDISGNADIDGTLEADAITVDGTALNTVIAGVTVTNATNSSHVLVTDNESTSENNLITFVEGATSSTGNVGLEMDGNLTYNPSTGTVTATAFAGALTGNVTGNASGTAATVTGAAQSNITSLGTLTGLAVTSSAVNIADFNSTNSSTSHITFRYNTNTVAGYIGNGSALGGSATDFIMRSEGGALKFATNADNLALTLDASQNATFAGAVTSSGNITGSRLFSGDGGNKTNPMIANGSDQDTGIFFPASNTMAFSAGDTESFRIAGAVATFAGNISLKEMATIIVSDIGGTGEDKGLKLENTGSGGKTWNITPGLVGLNNATFTIRNATDNINALTIDAAGNTSINAGNIVIGTPGKGIDFSEQTPTSVGGASNVAEVLDHYEEGTWTPAVQGQSTAGNWTYSFRTGEYTRIGNQVYISGSIRATVSSGANAAGSCHIINLPFTSEDTSNHNTGIQPAAGYASHVYLTVSPNTNFILVGRMDPSGITTALAAAQFNASNGLSQSEFQMFFDFTYTVPT